MLSYTNPDSDKWEGKQTKKENGNWYQYLFAAVRCQIFPIIYVILYYPSWFLLFTTGACFSTALQFIFPLHFYTFVFLFVFEWILCDNDAVDSRPCQGAILINFFVFFVFSSLSNAMIGEARGYVFFLFLFYSTSPFRLLAFLSFPRSFSTFRRCLLPLFLECITRVFVTWQSIDLEWNIRLARSCKKKFRSFFSFCVGCRTSEKTNITLLHTFEWISMLSRQLRLVLKLTWIHKKWDWGSSR